MLRRGMFAAWLALVLATATVRPLAGQTIDWVPTGGPGGGEVHSVARDSAGRLFATVVRAGVFRSDDEGATWQAKNAGLWGTSVQDILVLPDDRLLLAVGGYIHRSIDHGEWWTHEHFPEIGETRRLVLSPDGTTVFAAGNGTGVFRSVDAGVTWTRVLVVDAYVFDIAVSPTNPGLVFAVAGQFGPHWGLYRSTDGGTTWALLDTLPGNGTFGLRAVAVLGSGRVIVSREGCIGEPSQADPTVPWGDVYYSVDGGATWSIADTTITKCDARQFVEGDGVVWAPLRQDGGVAMSTDEGVTWHEAGLAPKDINTVLLGPQGSLLIGSTSTGIWLGQTSDPAAARSSNTGLRGANTLRVLPVAGGRIVAGTSYGVVQSEDAGQTWRTVASHSLGYESQSTCTLLNRAPGGVLVASFGGFLARSSDNGGTWSVSPYLDLQTNQWVGNWISASAAATDSVGRMYLAPWWGNSAIWVSTDNAATFQRASDVPVPWSGPARSIAVAGGDVLFVGTMYDGLFRSDDRGATLVQTAFAGQSVGALLVDGTALYAGVRFSGVWRSLDGGTNWARVYETTSEIYDLARNAEGALFVAQSGGVVTVSEDHGATWANTAPFPDRPWGLDVQGLGLDTAGYLYAATWGSGVYRSAASTHRADSTPPTVTATADPSELWPPNGRMVPVTIAGTASDTGSGVAGTTGSYRVTDEYGQVQPTGMFTVGEDGAFTVAVSLQARRFGYDKDGRTYSVTITVQDVAGNTSSTIVVVTVPHDQGK